MFSSELGVHVSLLRGDAQNIGNGSGTSFPQSDFMRWLTVSDRILLNLVRFQPGRSLVSLTCHLNMQVRVG